MNVFNRSDVKNHLHSPFLAKVHLGQPENQPDATGFSAAEPGAIKAGPSVFADDFVREHSSSNLAVALADQLIGSRSSQAPPASKSAQA